MTRQVNDRVQRLVKKIVQGFDPEKIILFGSHAMGEASEDSDIDLLVIKETSNTLEEARRIDATLFPRQVPLDIIVYRPEQVERTYAAGDFFIKDIIENGRVLYERRAEGTG